jgi:hypothetical protein
MKRRTSKTMVEFDSLPPTSRSLILTKLALEIVSSDCTNIFQLARKRNQHIHEVWRDICRKVAQPLCEMPTQVITSPGSHAPTSFGTHDCKISGKESDLNTAAIPSGLKKASSPVRPARRSQNNRSQNMRVILAVGLGVMVVAVIALFTGVAAMNSEQSLQTTTATENLRVHAKPGEIGPAAPKASLDPLNVPPPQGTVNRINAISKGFKK